jgi:recombination protein RecA
MAKKKRLTNEEIDERKAKLNLVLGEIKKKAGDKFSSRVQLGIPEKKRFLTGCYALDKLTGGFAAGLAVLWGPESGGKSTAAARVVAAGQLRGETWVWVDAEANMGQNKGWLKIQGVDLEKLIVIDGGTLENMMDAVIKLCREGVIDGFVIDSIAALSPEGEVFQKKDKKERSMSDDTQGLLQRKLGQFFRLVVGSCVKNNILGLLITQGYTDINAYGMQVAKGGNAMRHFGQCRLKIRRGTKGELINFGSIKEPEIVGHQVYIMLEKVKQDGTEDLYTEIKVPFLLDSGFSDEMFIMERAMVKGIITKSGSWYSYNEQQLGQGYKALAEYMLGNPELVEEIKEKLNAAENSEPEGEVGEPDPSGEADIG